MSQAKSVSVKKMCIGAVFTPLSWAIFAIQQTNLYEKWLKGATIFDPTMGEGNLLEAFLVMGLQQGKSIADLPYYNLFGNEMNEVFYQKTIQKFKEKYQINLRANFTNQDFLNLKKKPYDIILGNPPWQNFTDLPEKYKIKVKKHFIKYDLVANSQDVLLGNSRIDVAALLIYRSIQDFLQPNGEAVFFMPLSLLLNDGANKNFRRYCIKKTPFSIEKVIDFSCVPVFEQILTRYGLVHFQRNKNIRFPIDYYQCQNEEGHLKKYLAQPLFEPTDPLSVWSEQETIPSFHFISLKKECCPRQGVNTCGANDIFFFDNCHSLDKKNVLLGNKVHSAVILPKCFVYPVLTATNFQEQDELKAKKWVLLPYHTDGKLLNLTELSRYPHLYRYLLQHKNSLQQRKGVMLNAILQRGFWWALLGVGAYNFYPYKIVWEAYGKNTFKPQIVAGKWQANQSLQAFIPTKTYEEAKIIVKQLQHESVEKYLLSLKMEKTMNWAQPGKIKKLIQFE